MTKIRSAFWIFAALFFPAWAANSVAGQTKPEITIFLAGDIMLGRGVAPLLKARQTNLQTFGGQIRAADFAFGNLECALSDTPVKPSRKVVLTAPVAALQNLKTAGFDLLSVANNHALDAGENGVRRLKTELPHLGIEAVGAKWESDAGEWQAWRKTINGQRIAWLAATNWGPFQSGKARVRPLQSSKLVEQVRSLAAAGDAVFVSLHWGYEYQAQPTPSQRQLARELIEAGAVCIVGHHSHVAGPVEIYWGRPIFYSLGNFVFDRTPRPQSGLAAIVTLSEKSVAFQTFPVALPNQKITQEHVLGRFSGHFLRGEKAPQRLIWARLVSGSHVLRVFREVNGKPQLEAEGRHPEIEKVQVADVDGDGLDEVWLQLRQRSKLDVRVLPRPFLYGVEAKKGFRPRWRGSSLSRPFHEWAILPRATDAGFDLVALETNPDPKWRDFSWIAVYRWNGFGFRRLWDSPVRGSLRNLQAGRDEKGPFFQCLQQKTETRRTLILRPNANSETFSATLKSP